MANFLTEKIGPLPGWAWGGLAAGGALVVFVLVGNKSSSTSSTSTSSTGSLTNNPAASSIPYVPSVTVVNPSTGSSTTTGATAQTVTLGAAPGQSNSGIWASMVAAYPAANTPASQYTTLPFGQYQVAGSPSNNRYPVIVPGGGTMWVPAENVTSSSAANAGAGGGQGSYGTVGITPYMGWSSGAVAVGGGPNFIRGGKGGGKPAVLATVGRQLVGGKGGRGRPAPVLNGKGGRGGGCGCGG